MVATIAKPISTLFNDANEFDTQRTVADEINTYVCENVRYADHMRILYNYKDIEAKDISDCVTPFGGVAINKIQIISILNDKSESCGGSKLYTGRIYRSKNGDLTGTNYYEALGKWYYGKQSYYFDCSNLKATSSQVKIGTYVITKDIPYTDFIDGLSNNTKPVADIKSAKIMDQFADGSAQLLNIPGGFFAVDGNGTLQQGNNTYILFTLPN